MKALVTGSAGFIGKNLVVALRRSGVEVAEVDAASGPAAVAAGVHDVDAVFHLAGVNRPEDDAEFESGNVGSLEDLLGAVERGRPQPGRAPVIVLSSSTQAGQDNPYGRSKLLAEQRLESYAGRTDTPAVIYRLPGVFGKWCRPHYNSVVATFCHRIARGLPISISDPATTVELVHVDDVVAEFARQLECREPGVRRGEVGPTFRVSLGELAERLQAFRDVRRTLAMPDLSDPLTVRLLGTYTAYLPEGDLAYALERRTDGRGALAELLKAPCFGQLFVSRSRPGVTRGNHYHDNKVEKFCVLEGEALIRFRSVLGRDVLQYRVSGTDFKVVDIPPGMTHSIENVGRTEMVVLFWASEGFDPDRPDTYPSEVSDG